MTNRSPMTYFGGKTLLAPKIVRLLPAHSHYVEPYCGSLAVLLAKEVSPMETVNDLDGDLMTFWRMLRDRPDELIRVCALTPHSRVEHQLSYDRDGCDELEIARRVWVTLTQGRGGTPRRSGWRHYVRPVGKFGMPAYLDSYVDRMNFVTERLHNISLECRPALELVSAYGKSPDTLLYIDPPYLGDARSSPEEPRRAAKRYNHEMLGETEHSELAGVLKACKASVVLSGYPSSLYNDLYQDWHRVEFSAGTGQSARGEWSTRTEVLWSNRELRYEVGLFDEENVS